MTDREGPGGRARTLAQVYRRFGEADAADTSPLYERVVCDEQSVRQHGAMVAVQRQPQRFERIEFICALESAHDDGRGGHDVVTALGMPSESAAEMRGRRLSGS